MYNTDCTNRMSPCASTCSQVSAAGVPLDIGHAVMVGSAQLLNATTPLLFRDLALSAIIQVEIKIPEFELRFRRGADSG